MLLPDSPCAAEIPDCGDLHVVDVPPVRRARDRVEVRGSHVALLRQLDLNDTMATVSRCLAENAKLIVVEVTLKNYETLLELFAIHVVARGPGFRPEDHGHRL